MKGRGPLDLLPFALRLPGIPERILEEGVRDGGRFGFLSGLRFLGSLQLSSNELLDDLVVDTLLLGTGLNVPHFRCGAFANRPTVATTDALEES